MSPCLGGSGSRRGGFTLVEILVATAVLLLMMVVLVQVFAIATGTAMIAQSLRETEQRVNSTITILRSDLNGVTVILDPVQILLDPPDNEPIGYLEITENSVADLEGEDGDDVLAFTTSQPVTTPFVGLYGFDVDPGPDGIVGTADDIFTPRTIESNTAEVVYFLRNGTLYRRQLLVEVPQPLNSFFPTPGLPWNGGGNQLGGQTVSWYSWFDISARPDPAGNDPIVNTLGDLALRENRYAHDPRAYWANDALNNDGDAAIDEHDEILYPFRAIEFQHGTLLADLIHKDRDFNNNNNAIPAGGDLGGAPWVGRPLFRETADGRWSLPDSNQTPPNPTVPLPANAASGSPLQDDNLDGLIDVLDALGNPIGDYGDPSEPFLPLGFQRFSDDILLTNVLSFDVKVYDPGAPIYQHPGPDGILNTADDITVGPPYDLDADGDYDELTGVPDLSRPIAVGTYVDLGYGANRGAANFYSETLLNRAPVFSETNLPLLPVPPLFWHNGARSEPSTALSRLVPKRTYDTWSSIYENDNIDQNNQDGDDNPTTGADEGTDGADNNGNGLIDEKPDGLDSDADGWVDEGPVVPLGVGPGADIAEMEWEAPPPYAVPLRGIQIKIRVLDPSTGQAREFTIVHSFIN